MSAGQVQRSHPHALAPVLGLSEISTVFGSQEPLGRVGGMPPAALRLICASLSSWGRCLFAFGSKSLAWLSGALAWRTALAGF